jgi:hypothetical protein
MRPYSAEGFRNASLVLGLINVYQPVTRDILLTKLGPGREEELVNALEFLSKERLIRELAGDRFRATWRGQSSLWSDALERSRDIQRMWYLAELAQEKPQIEEGEDLQ